MVRQWLLLDHHLTCGLLEEVPAPGVPRPWEGGEGHGRGAHLQGDRLWKSRAPLDAGHLGCVCVGGGRGGSVRERERER